jgi:hypothetical protein
MKNPGVRIQNPGGKNMKSILQLWHLVTGFIGHLPAASLGQYASLTVVVRGKGQRKTDRSQSKEERDFSVGAAFSRDLTISTI